MEEGMRLLRASGHDFIYTLAGAGGATGCAGAAAFGAVIGGVDAAATAGFVGRYSMFGQLGVSGGGEGDFAEAMPPELEAATAAVAGQPRHILFVVKRLDGAVTAAFPPIAFHLVGAEHKMKAYLRGGKVPPHRLPAGPTWAYPGQHVVKMFYVASDNDDCELVLEKGAQRLVARLPAGLSCYALGKIGAGRVRVPDSEHFLMHGSWVRGAPGRSPSLEFVRQVVVDAPNEPAAVRAVLVAAAAEGARLREEGALGPVVAGGAGGELVQHNNLSS